MLSMSVLTVDNITLSEREFQQISDIVYEHCGIHLHDGKKELVRARLAKLVRQNNFHTFKDFVHYVLEDKTGRAFSKLIDALSTNLTSFFRERQHFEFLEGKFLPSLLERKQKNGTFRIRGWSAGCSSGEEPYSIGITLLEAIQKRGRWDMKLLATDISMRMLDIAKKYEEEEVSFAHFVQTDICEDICSQVVEQLRELNVKVIQYNKKHTIKNVVF